MHSIFGALILIISLINDNQHVSLTSTFTEYYLVVNKHRLAPHNEYGFEMLELLFV